MTIEKSPVAAPGPKPAARADSHAVKSKSASAEGGPDGGAGGFSAILGALGDDASGASTAAGTDTSQPDAALAAATAFDASSLLQQNPQLAAAQAAQAVQAAGAAQDASGVAAGGALALQGAAAARAAAARAGTDASAMAAPGMQSGAQGLLQAAGRAKAGKDALLAGAESSSASGAATNAASGSGAASSQAMEPGKLLALLEQNRVAQGAAPEPMLALVDKLDKAGTADKSQSERSGAALKEADPTYSASSLGVSGPDFSTLDSAAPAALAPEMQVAEQVSYWISHNIQNAELKLDGLGQSPVEVSISMQGKEAHISFRSDEAATRDVLENAGAQLKDALQREGVLLAGVSVGTSGSGDADGSGRRGRQDMRQGVLAPLKLAAQDAAPRLGRALAAGAGRSVDLFV